MRPAGTSVVGSVAVLAVALLAGCGTDANGAVSSSSAGPPAVRQTASTPDSPRDATVSAASGPAPSDSLGPTTDTRPAEPGQSGDPSALAASEPATAWADELPPQYTVPIGDAPAKAWDTLAVIDETDEAPDGYRGGTTFGNREGLLPDYDKNGKDIDYREWDVNRYIRGVNRGAERVVTGSDGAAYYTSDHYRSFVMFRAPEL